MENNTLKELIQKKYQFKTDFDCEVAEEDEMGDIALDGIKLDQEDCDYIYTVASEVLQCLESTVDFDKDNVYYAFKKIDENYVRIYINIIADPSDYDENSGEFSLDNFSGMSFGFEDTGQISDSLFSFLLSRNDTVDDYKIVDFQIDNNYIDVMNFIASRAVITSKAQSFIQNHFSFLVIDMDKNAEFKTFYIQLKFEYIESSLSYDENEWSLFYDLFNAESFDICLEKDIDRVKLLLYYMDLYCVNSLNDSKDDVYYKIEKLVSEKVGQTKKFKDLYEYFLQEDILVLQQYMDQKMKPYMEIKYFKMITQDTLYGSFCRFEVKESYTYLVFNFNTFIYSFKVDLVNDLNKVCNFMYCLQICSLNIDFSFFAPLGKTIKRDRDIDSAFKYFIAEEPKNLDKNIKILRMLVE